MKDNKTYVAKAISFSYPTSSNAVEQGFHATGCWSVRLFTSVETCIGGKDMAHFQYKDAAIAYAESLPYPYTEPHKKYFF